LTTSVDIASKATYPKASPASSTIKKETFTTNEARIECNNNGLKNPFIFLNDENFVKKIGIGLYKKVKK
jgi:hypothetical protein